MKNSLKLLTILAGIGLATTSFAAPELKDVVMAKAASAKDVMSNSLTPEAIQCTVNGRSENLASISKNTKLFANPVSFTCSIPPVQLPQGGDMQGLVHINGAHNQCNKQTKTCETTVNSVSVTFTLTNLGPISIKDIAN